MVCSPLSRLALIGVLIATGSVACKPASPPVDRALTLQPLDTPASSRSGQAALNRGPDGRVLLSWLDHSTDSAVTLRSAEHTAGGWQQLSTVATGRDWFVNWADFGAVVALGGDKRLAHWRVRSGPATYAYDVHVALSSDAGQTWQAPFVLHDDGTRTEHGFVSVYPTPDGAGLIWLDGRETGGASDHDHHDAAGAMTLYGAQLNGSDLTSKPIDTRVCDCCQTASALTDRGPVIAYRDRSDDEVRDIMVRYREAGTWSAPVTVGDDHWKIAGCPVNGPDIAASGNRVAVAWFTGADDKPRVQVAFSNDAGRHVEPAMLIDGDAALGRVAVTWLNTDDVVVSWMCQLGNDDVRLCLRRVSRDGAMSERFTSVRLDRSRRSGFPQMRRSGDKLIFAWQSVDPDNDHTRVVTGSLPVGSLYTD